MSQRLLGISAASLVLLGYAASVPPGPAAPDSLDRSFPPDSLTHPAGPPAGLPDSVRTRDPRVALLEREFRDLLVRLHPVRATLLGLHQGDGHLGPPGEAGVEERRRSWTGLAARLEALGDSVTGPDDRFDVALMRHAARLYLFELDSLRVRARDPRLPLGTLASGIYGLLAWDYAPLEERVASLVSRLREVPGFLEEESRLLENPPRVLVDQALAHADALSSLLLDDLPPATEGIEDQALARSLAGATREALRAVWQYRENLLMEVMPRSSESFALGSEMLLAYLHAGEGIETTFEELRERADRELARLEASFREVATGIDSTRTPREIMFEVSRDHPAADSLISEVTRAVEEIRAYMAARGAIPGPDSLDIAVRPTPQISRWANASLGATGPFEDSGFRAVFYITPPDPGASPGEREEHLRFLCRPVIRNLAVHEAYPGHGLQAYALSRTAGTARRIVSSQAFVEGWAHYVESLVLERGYREGDDAFRLATLQSALRRAGRFRVALGLHVEGWTVPEATRFLEEHAYLETSVARREVDRGVVDPLYLVYTLGKLEIRALREEMERREGEAFDLKRFHRRLLGFGAHPLPLLRARLLSPDMIGPRFLDE